MRDAGCEPAEVRHPPVLVAGQAVARGRRPNPGLPHPSGDPTPSNEDLKATRDMVNAGRVLGIPLMDHVIVGKSSPSNACGYVSLKESGMMM